MSSRSISFSSSVIISFTSILFSSFSSALNSLKYFFATINSPDVSSNTFMVCSPMILITTPISWFYFLSVIILYCLIFGFFFEGGKFSNCLISLFDKSFNFVYQVNDKGSFPPRHTFVAAQLSHDLPEQSEIA